MRNGIPSVYIYKRINIHNLITMNELKKHSQEKDTYLGFMKEDIKISNVYVNRNQFDFFPTTSVGSLQPCRSFLWKVQLFI